MPRREDGSVCYSDTHYRDTWTAMESLVDKRLVKAIGLSNFNARQIDDIFSMARHKPVVNQVAITCTYDLQRNFIKSPFYTSAIGGVPSFFVSTRSSGSLPVSVSQHLKTAMYFNSSY